MIFLLHIEIGREVLEMAFQAIFEAWSINDEETAF